MLLSLFLISIVFLSGCTEQDLQIQEEAKKELTCSDINKPSAEIRCSKYSEIEYDCNIKIIGDEEVSYMVVTYHEKFGAPNTLKIRSMKSGETRSFKAQDWSDFYGDPKGIYILPGVKYSDGVGSRSCDDVKTSVAKESWIIK